MNEMKDKLEPMNKCCTKCHLNYTLENRLGACSNPQCECHFLQKTFLPNDAKVTYSTPPQGDKEYPGFKEHDHREYPRELTQSDWEEEFDSKQRLFLAGKYHSTEFNKWFKSVLQSATQQAIEDADQEFEALYRASQRDLARLREKFLCVIDEEIAKNEDGAEHTDDILEVLSDLLNLLKKDE